MSETPDLVKAPAAKGAVRVSDHGFDELAADGILVRDVVQAVARAELLEDYPDYPKGRFVLVLQHDSSGRPVHVVWGVPLGCTTPAVLVTAYRPDPKGWTDDLRRRQR